MTAAQASLAELISRGITINAAEAVAIAQTLMHERSGSTMPTTSAHEPPLPENVYLSSDGAVVCQGCEIPTVSEVALLLRELLPIGSAGIPGGLQYAIARALMEVDAPPFDSVEGFSGALGRFERGDRAQLVRGLLEGAQGNAITRSRPSTERRRTNPATFGDLRRALHEADARLYEQKLTMETLTAARPRRKRNGLAVAACLTTAAAGVAAGNAMHGRLASWTSAPTKQSLPVPAAVAARAAQPQDVVLDAPLPKARAVSLPRPTPKRIDGSSSRVPTKAALKRPARARSSDGNGGVFKRLRLEWLRKVFTRRT